MTRDDPGLAALTGLSDPVRRRLYEFVAERTGPVGREDAAAATGVSRALAAYHLDKLVELGLLTASYQRLTGRAGPGAGRPAKLYARSGAEFAASVPPREYELAARLLAVAVESDPGGTCRTELLEAAARFGRGLAEHRRDSDSPAPGAGLATEAALHVLREHGYEPWLDHSGQIRLHNCPFHRLAASHPGLVCEMNLALIKGLATGLAAGGLRPVLAPQPGSCCVVMETSQPGETRRPAPS
jgi:predicted ArsR family transcriptional regulator